MYTDENYLWGLVAYGLGFVLILPAIWWIVRGIFPWVAARIVVLLFLVAFFLTPVPANPDSHYLAPAWLVAGFEFFKPTSPEGPVRAIAPMAVVYAGLLLAAGLWYLVARILAGKRTGNRART